MRSSGPLAQVADISDLDQSPEERTKRLEKAEALFGSKNYPRLQELKKNHDPENLRQMYVIHPSVQ